MAEGPETSEGSNVDIDHVFACFVLNLTKRKTLFRECDSNL